MAGFYKCGACGQEVPIIGAHVCTSSDWSRLDAVTGLPRGERDREQAKCPTCVKRAKDLFQSDTAYERAHCPDPWHEADSGDPQARVDYPTLAENKAFQHGVKVGRGPQAREPQWQGGYFGTLIKARDLALAELVEKAKEIASLRERNAQLERRVELWKNAAKFNTKIRSDRIQELERECEGLREALQGIIDIGKRDMSNPKYDGYFESAKAALRGGEIKAGAGEHTK